MSIMKITKTLAIVAKAVVIAVGAVTTSSSGLASAQDQKFMAELSSQEEVPPTDSQATGSAEFTPMGSDSVCIMLMLQTYKMLQQDTSIVVNKAKMDL